MRPAALALCGMMLIVMAAADAEAAYIVGDPIADFTLNDAYGTPVSLYDSEDMVVFLTFWTDT